MSRPPTLLARNLTLLLACLGIAIASPTRATTIDFDAYGDGTAISNQYQALGVLFEGTAGGPAHIYLDPPEAPSSPNILVGDDNFSNLYVRFVNPSTGLPSPNEQPCGATVDVVSVGVAVITIQSKNGAGTVLESFVLNHPGGPPNGFGNVDPITFSIGPIASIEMLFTVPGPPGVDGVGIDNLSFALGCPTPTRPSTWGKVKARYR